MGLFSKIVQKLTIDFYSRSEASLRFESLTGKQPESNLISYYFLTYYAKMLYNLGSGLDSRALHLFISDVAADALFAKDKIDKSLRLVEYKGKGSKLYEAEWNNKGAIKTKVARGEEDHYANASVLLFLDYLNQSLDETSRRELFYGLYEFQSAVADNGIPRIRDIMGWPNQIIREVESNLGEYERMREEAEKEYYANRS